jgi:transposase
MSSMITITKEHKIYIACQPVDFRRGIDGYAALCRSQLQLNPFSGHCFIFRNKKRTAIKILLYHSNGFWLCHKRLSKGQFKQWPTQASAVVLMNSQQLNVLLQQ